MKCVVTGYKRNTGVSAKSGKPYDMCQINVMQPVDGRSGDTFGGHRGVELAATPEVVTAVEALTERGSRQPLLELDVSLSTFAGAQRVTVVGVKPVKP